MEKMFLNDSKMQNIIKNWHYKNLNKKIPLEKILVENSTYCRNTLKRRLLEDGILKNECSICGQQPIWNNKPLVMVIDHINGINNDNRLENLRLVCRHCDSQLPTFCGRNVKTNRKINVIINNCIDCGNIISSRAKRCVSCKNISMKYKIIKRKRKVENRPNNQELTTLVKNYPLTIIGKMFGVCDNAIRKWCIAENIDFKNLRQRYNRAK